MHIGLISAAFPPDLDGIGDYTWWMAKTLVELGHRVTVFTRIGDVKALPGAAIIVPFYDPARPESFGELASVLEKMRFIHTVIDEITSSPTKLAAVSG